MLAVANLRHPVVLCSTPQRPEYQVQAVNGYLGKPNLPAQQYWNKSGRAIPDVSALATNFQVRYSHCKRECCAGKAFTQLVTLRSSSLASSDL